MARAKKSKEVDKGEPVSLELRASEAVARPLFSNYVLSSHSQFVGANPQVTLTFIHVYPVPVAPSESKQEGEVVARVVLSSETAKALRNLLNKQQPLTPTELDALRAARRTRGRK